MYWPAQSNTLKQAKLVKQKSDDIFFKYEEIAKIAIDNQQFAKNEEHFFLICLIQRSLFFPSRHSLCTLHCKIVKQSQGVTISRSHAKKHVDTGVLLREN